MVKDESVVVSPCIGICALDENDVCVGCYRTGLEISHWGGMDASERNEVLRLVKEREKSSYI
ncbi:DUF1289 domain-containing protein [Alkalimarinus coralli]|uniref:DUF1289 domain-containing protein n=1 Tax=Alkalimarinus coralli TaxID=2935863 RepID=UPI00202AC33D|nr:DUF1289 domain-containing protein [Alkalimarinus coralli]